MRDVAAAAGVSTALVSIVFRGVPGASDETRARVQAVARDLGYTPNRTASLMKRTRTRHLGVAMRVRNAFHSEVVEGIQAAADEAGYELVLAGITSGHPEERAVETLLEFRCESLLLVGSDMSVNQLASIGARAPAVVVGRRVKVPNVDVVRSADRKGMAMVVDHLVELGHRSIAHVDGGDHPIARERSVGYHAAMRRHGLETIVVTGGNTEGDGRSAAEQLLARATLPTAVCTFNDHCALGLVDVITKQGVSVPGECSVTGYDNSSFAGLSAFDLTSVSQEAALMATAAVRTAIARIEDPSSERVETVLAPRLVVRGSTGPVLPRVTA
jgi:LacI family transcriptional regulator